jgi:hypothetical protein
MSPWLAALPCLALLVLTLIWMRDQRILARLLRQASSGAAHPFEGGAG